MKTLTPALTLVTLGMLAYVWGPRAALAVLATSLVAGTLAYVETRSWFGISSGHRTAQKAPAASRRHRPPERSTEQRNGDRGREESP